MTYSAGYWAHRIINGEWGIVDPTEMVEEEVVEVWSAVLKWRALRL